MMGGVCKGGREEVGCGGSKRHQERGLSCYFFLNAMKLEISSGFSLYAQISRCSRTQQYEYSYIPWRERVTKNPNQLVLSAYI